MRRLSFVICSTLMGVFLVAASLWFFLPKAEAESVAQSALPPLFTDDFESGTSNWTAVTGITETLVDGTTVYSTTYSGTFARSIVSDTQAFGWTDYSIRARIKVIAYTGSAFANFMVRYTDTGNYYIMALKTDTPSVVLYRRYGGTTSGRTLGTCSGATEPLCNISLNTWYTPTLVADENTLTVYMSGTPVLTVTDTSAEAFYTGTIGIGTQRATAEFDDVVVSPIPATLNVTKLGLGDGLVTSVPAGIYCGVSCTADFVKGTVVTLTAVPAPASTFEGWGGACLGPGTVIIPGTASLPPQCVVPMTAAMDVTATFSTYNIFMPIVSKN